VPKRHGERLVSRQNVPKRHVFTYATQCMCHFGTLLALAESAHALSAPNKQLCPVFSYPHDAAFSLLYPLPVAEDGKELRQRRDKEGSQQGFLHHSDEW